MLRRAGTQIGTSNRLIAATALEHDAVVVTSDVRDFMRVPGLTVEDWRAVVDVNLTGTFITARAAARRRVAGRLP
jgi:NAD(P)-dependent dehydrogenase (short-subunit alcohol dehydrogenase family)